MQNVYDDNPGLRLAKLLQFSAAPWRLGPININTAAGEAKESSLQRLYNDALNR